MYHVDTVGEHVTHDCEESLNKIEIFARSKYFEKFEYEQGYKEWCGQYTEIYVVLSFKRLDQEMVQKMNRFLNELRDLDHQDIVIASLIDEFNQLNAIIHENGLNRRAARLCSTIKNPVIKISYWFQLFNTPVNIQFRQISTMGGKPIFIDFHLRRSPVGYKFVDDTQVDFGVCPDEVVYGALKTALHAIREKARPDAVSMIFEWGTTDGDHLPEIALMIIEQVCTVFPYAEINVTSLRLPKFEAVSACRLVQRLPQAVRKTFVHTFFTDAADAIQTMVIIHSGPDLVKIKSKL